MSLMHCVSRLRKSLAPDGQLSKLLPVPTSHCCVVHLLACLPVVNVLHLMLAEHCCCAVRWPPAFGSCMCHRGCLYVQTSRQALGCYMHLEWLPTHGLKLLYVCMHCLDALWVWCSKRAMKSKGTQADAVLLVLLLLLLTVLAAIKVYLNDGDKEPDFVVKVNQSKHAAWRSCPTWHACIGEDATAASNGAPDWCQQCWQFRPALCHTIYHNHLQALSHLVCRSETRLFKRRTSCPTTAENVAACCCCHLAGRLPQQALQHLPAHARQRRGHRPSAAGEPLLQQLCIPHVSVHCSSTAWRDACLDS